MTAVTPREQMGLRVIAAAEALLEQGVAFSDITVSQLVKAAGVSRSRFYVHFRDKGDVLRAWFGTIRRDVADVDDAWFSLREDASETDLRSAIQRITMAYQPPRLIMAVMYDQAALDPATRAEVEQIEQHRSARLEAHIAAGQAGGWIDPELLPCETAAWLTHTGARGYQQMVETAGATVEEFVDSYAHHVWLVLYEHAPSRQRRGRRRTRV